MLSWSIRSAAQMILMKYISINNLSVVFMLNHLTLSNCTVQYKVGLYYRYFQHSYVFYIALAETHDPHLITRSEAELVVDIIRIC